MTNGTATRGDFNSKRDILVIETDESRHGPGEYPRLRSRADWASVRAPSIGFSPESEAVSGETEEQSAKPACLSADAVS